MADEKSLNIKITPPQFAVYVVGTLIMFLIVASLVGAVAIYNKIKEGRYIGKSAEYRNTISISGEGRVFAKPDIGQVDLSVVTESATVAKAVSENNEKMNKIIQAMKDLGINEDDLKTATYNINPKYQYISGKSLIIGYEVNQTLQVKIRDLDKTSQILEKATDLGANQVGALNFTFDDSERLREEARQKAIDNAKSKAEGLANTLGIKLVTVVGFDESLEPEPTPFYREYGVGGVGGAVPAPEIQPGQNEVVVNVSLVYEIRE